MKGRLFERKLVTNKMNQIEIPLDNQRWYVLAAFGVFIALVVIIMALNFRLQPAPPVTVNVNALECLGKETAAHLSEGWIRVNAEDEHLVIALTMKGKAEWRWFKTEECREAWNITRRFLIDRMWWRMKK